MKFLGNLLGSFIVGQVGDVEGHNIQWWGRGERKTTEAVYVGLRIARTVFYNEIIIFQCSRPAVN